MEQQKFFKKDKVLLTNRIPQWVKDKVRKNQVRTVVEVFYDYDAECCFYGLGNNNKSDDELAAYFFRSYQLQPMIAGRPVGRPCTKKRRR